MTTREHESNADAERERRDELERLQVELREAKVALERSATEEDPELPHLRELVAQAGTRRATALARRQTLETEHRQLGDTITELRQELMDEKAARRPQRGPLFPQLSWDAPQPQQQNPGVSILIMLGGATLFLLMAAGHIIGSCHG